MAVRDPRRFDPDLADAVMILIFMVIVFFATLGHAQFIGYTSPQTVNATPFNSVACTGSEQTATVNNVGQSVHFAYMTKVNITSGVMLIKGSYDGVTFQTISTQATIGGFAQSPSVFGAGSFPVLQISVTCTGTGGNHFTVRYSGTSAAPGPPFAQSLISEYAKNLAYGLNAGTPAPTFPTLNTPYGSSAGAIVFTYTDAAGPASSQLNLTCNTPSSSGTALLINPLAVTQDLQQIFIVPAKQCDTITVTYGPGGVSASNFSLDYVFATDPKGFLPASAQPPPASNSQATSGTDAAVTATLAASGTVYSRPYLYRVSARCSAGTSSVTVANGATTVWTTGAAEVGTTNSTFTWNPGLVGSANTNMTVTLATCGGGNTGTLMVQASVF